MKKYLLLTIAFAIILSQASSYVMAATHRVSGPVSIAIKKYKRGNYTGCLQDMQMIIKRDPSNAVAYYYIAMSYAQAGKKDKAIDAYKKVLTLRPNAVLYNYATTGKRCLETPDKCRDDGSGQSDIDRFVNSPYGDGLSSKVRSDVEQKRLDALKNKVNSGADVNNYQMRRLDNYGSKIETPDKVADSKVEKKVEKAADASVGSSVDKTADKQPTNDEIVAALKVLNKAGLNPYSQNAYGQMGANPEMAQLNMMMGSNQNNNGNSAINMIPLMLAQQKSAGANGASNAYTAQLMQSMIMNSMLPNFSMNTNDDNNK